MDFLLKELIHGEFFSQKQYKSVNKHPQHIVRCRHCDFCTELFWITKFCNQTIISKNKTQLFFKNKKLSRIN